MSKLKIKVKNISDESLYTHKVVKVGSKKIESPIKSVSVQKMTKKDVISKPSRTINELYFKVGPNKLKESKVSFDSNIEKNLKTSVEDFNNENINVVFAEWNTDRPFSESELKYLADIIYSTSDILTTPLMPKILKSIKDDDVGLESKFFDYYKDNLREFIKTFRQIDGRPVMGTIPALPWAFTKQIIDIYLEKGVRAFCFNFNGRTVIAENQLVNMVTPLMRRIGEEDLVEDVFFYVLNAHRGRSPTGKEYIPAKDFMSFGFGFDVLGDKHVGLKLPPNVIKKLDSEEDTFKLFHRDQYVYRDYEFNDELKRNIPSETGLDKDRIVNRPQDRYRLSRLLNTEQKLKETKILASTIEENRVVDYVNEKKGVTPKNIKNMQETKENLEEGQQQTSLKDLDEYF